MRNIFVGHWLFALFEFLMKFRESYLTFIRIFQHNGDVRRGKGSIAQLFVTLLYVIIMSRTGFRVSLHSIVCLTVKELLARSKRHI